MAALGAPKPAIYLHVTLLLLIIGLHGECASSGSNATAAHGTDPVASDTHVLGHLSGF